MTDGEGDVVMKVLVTGGAGFIGSHLVRQLMAEGIEVTALDNLSTGLRENLPEGAAFVEMDVNNEAFESVVAVEGFDAIVHLAGQTMVDVSIRDPLLDAMASAGAEVVAVSPDVMASLAEREAAEGLVATFDLFETSLDELGLGALRDVRAEVGRSERGRLWRQRAQRLQVWPRHQG